jgi:inosose dehydratase
MSDAHDDGVRLTRRGFLGAAAVAAVGVSLPGAVGAGDTAVNLAAFDTPITPRPFALRLGYAAITWDGKDDQAIDDIAAAGFRGSPLRTSALEANGDKPEALRARLQAKGLDLLCFSSGSVDVDPAREAEYVDTHVKHARFVKALGGGLLQLTSRRPKDRAPTPEEFTRLGRLLTEIGRRTLDLGVRVVYHNHMHAFGEAPDEVARVLDAADRHFVWLLLDIAHYQQGGGDPAAAVARHRDRLAILHLKDVVDTLRLPL